MISMASHGLLLHDNNYDEILKWGTISDFSRGGLEVSTL